MIYFIECDYGKLGRVFIETPLERNSLAGVVDDIHTGEHCDVVRVLEVIPDEGTCRDVTEDVAWRVYHLVESEGEGLPSHLEEYLELHCGIPAANALRNYREVA